MIFSFLFLNVFCFHMEDKLWAMILILALLKPQLLFFYGNTGGGENLETRGFNSMQIKITCSPMWVSENHFSQYVAEWEEANSCLRSLHFLLLSLTLFFLLIFPLCELKFNLKQGKNEWSAEPSKCTTNILRVLNDQFFTLFQRSEILVFISHCKEAEKAQLHSSVCLFLFEV